MKNILLPTDFSKNAYNAIQYAVQLFKEEECVFYILHTITPGSYSIASIDDGPSRKVIEEVTRQNAEEKLHEIVQELETKFPNSKHRFEKIISFSSFSSEVKSAVKERAIDLVIMGTKGATGAKEVFLGTNTMSTIQKVPVAVIAIPKEFSYEKPKEILFTTDFKFSMENKYLPVLRSLCARYSARLNVLNIYAGKALEPMQEAVKDRLAAYFKNNAYLFHELEYMNVAEGVEHFQIKHKINFLVMVNNKHTFLENLLFKPVIKEIVYHTHIPFMVIPSVALMNS